MISINEFIDLVHSMRSMQKRYFKMKTKDMLVKAKALEAQVDEALEKIEKQEIRDRA